MFADVASMLWLSYYCIVYCVIFASFAEELPSSVALCKYEKTDRVLFQKPGTTRQINKTMQHEPAVLCQNSLEWIFTFENSYSTRPDCTNICTYVANLYRQCTHVCNQDCTHACTHASTHTRSKVRAVEHLHRMRVRRSMVRHDHTLTTEQVLEDR